MFQDVHVMMFIGFGYLMTFIYKYSYSALAYTMLLTMISIEWFTGFNAFIYGISNNGQS